MALFTYLRQADNLIPAALLTPDTEADGFPITNAQTEPVAEVYRSTSAAAQKILIDFDEPVEADFFAVVNHNFTSGATITLRGGSSQDPDGEDFEMSFSWTVQHGFGARRNTWLRIAAAETWQYWSLTINDAANPNGLLEIGLLMMGEATELSRGFNFGWTKQPQTLNQVLESEYGVLNVGANLFQLARFSFSWKTKDLAEREELDVFLTGLERERGGLFFIPDPSELKSYYGRLLTDHTITRTSPDIAQFNGLEFLEDSPGKAIF